MRGYVLVCCIALLIMACSKVSSNESVVADDVFPKAIHLGAHREPAKDISFLALLNHVSYIPLETRSTVLLTRCSKVIADKNRFIVLDRENSSVHVFSAEGKHLFVVGSIGHGPGEFLRLDDMEIDTEHHQLLLWSNDNTSVFTYSLEDGKFIEQTNMPFYGSRFGILGDHYISYTDYNIGRTGEARNLFVSDRKGVVKHSYFPFPADRFTAAFSFKGVLSKNDQGYLYAHALSDTVYQISNDLKIFPKYHFDFGKATWTKHFGIFDHEEYLTKGLDYSVLYSPLFEWGDYLFFSFVQNRYVKKGFAHIGRNEIYTTDDFEGDIEFDLFNIPAGANGSVFISALYPEQVYAAKDKYPDFDERVARNPSLKKIIDSLKMEDNPILMLYSMK
jgi:hypothetical protein